MPTRDVSVIEISNSRDFDVQITEEGRTRTYFITRYWNENSEAVWYDEICRVDGGEATREIRDRCIKEINTYLASPII